jgi:hypothetical protein
VAVWGDVHRALVERCHHLVGAARYRHELELDLLAGEEAPLLREMKVERRHAAHGRGDLPIA